jgi:hypothetical protein
VAANLFSNVMKDIKFNTCDAAKSKASESYTGMKEKAKGSIAQANKALATALPNSYKDSEVRKSIARLVGESKYTREQKAKDDANERVEKSKDTEARVVQTETLDSGFKGLAKLLKGVNERLDKILKKPVGGTGVGGGLFDLLPKRIPPLALPLLTGAAMVASVAVLTKKSIASDKDLASLKGKYKDGDFDSVRDAAINAGLGEEQAQNLATKDKVFGNPKDSKGFGALFDKESWGFGDNKKESYSATTGTPEDTLTPTEEKQAKNIAKLTKTTEDAYKPSGFFATMFLGLGGMLGKAWDTTKNIVTHPVDSAKGAVGAIGESVGAAYTGWKLERKEKKLKSEQKDFNKNMDSNGGTQAVSKVANLVVFLI